ncbi:3'-5' exonuclease [Fredinandcohnia sp. SECRCQ15]|uniref:3'-5' exonuclease n=2 Tax=Fredinandcohnia quinoae TaxID=2918902 RepID=A0AAW5E1M6_9BACI|nr:exonuclease domain-containing protein [Fredinandcohnia sp. SECRCQ15]MCH1625175.1 3'-5' exonuclease [Fredinandcohnia sp. SECRCQ15]
MPQFYLEIPLSTPIEEISFTVFDTETTGFQIGTSDRMIEIAAVHVQGFEVDEFDIYQSYINPQRQISREIIELTGISNEKVENAPFSIEAITQFFTFAEKYHTACLVGHYVSFDILTLKSELKRERIAYRKQPTIDTLDLIGFISPSYDMRDLHKYAQNFGTRIYERHTARGDALTTAYLFVELLYLFKERGNHTWGDLLHAAENQSRYF